MLNKLVLKNVRNFSNLTLDFKKNIVILVGGNATGKTTILESIYLLGLTKSPRTMDEKEIIKFECDFAKITGYFPDEYQIIISEQKRILKNKQEIKKFSDHIGQIPLIMFSPNDLQLVYGAKGERRKFMDINISQLSKNYLQELNEYKKILKQRNELLKNLNLKDNYMFLDIITRKYVESAKKIMNSRLKFINEINSSLKKITDEKIELFYSPSIKEDDLLSFLESKKEYDIQTNISNYGPHRDDIRFTLDNKDTSYCSQGQVRTIVLEAKLAIVELIKKYKKQNPIVLLDDVFSELDEKRKNSLLEIIKEYQTFITTTDILNIKINDAQIINLKELNNNGNTL